MKFQEIFVNQQRIQNSHFFFCNLDMTCQYASKITEIDWIYPKALKVLETTTLENNQVLVV